MKKTQRSATSLGRSIYLLVVARNISLLLVPLLVVLFYGNNNQTLFLWLNAHLSTWLPVEFWATITNFGDGFFLFPVAMLLLRKNPEQHLTLVVVMVLAVLTLNIPKAIFDIDRPLAVLGESAVQVIGPHLNSQSMPSGHSGTVFLMAGLAFLYLSKRAALIITALCAITAISRVAVGAHWPLDTIVGSTVGLLTVMAGSWITSRWKANRYSQCFYLFLGMVAAINLPFYHNGFQDFTSVRGLQYVLSFVALSMTLLEARHFIRETRAQKQIKAKSPDNFKKNHERPRA